MGLTGDYGPKRWTGSSWLTIRLPYGPDWWLSCGLMVWLVSGDDRRLACGFELWIASGFSNDLISLWAWMMIIMWANGMISSGVD